MEQGVSRGALKHIMDATSLHFPCLRHARQKTWVVFIDRNATERTTRIAAFSCGCAGLLPCRLRPPRLLCSIFPWFSVESAGSVLRRTEEAMVPVRPQEHVDQTTGNQPLCIGLHESNTIGTGSSHQIGRDKAGIEGMRTRHAIQFIFYPRFLVHPCVTDRVSRCAPALGPVWARRPHARVAPSGPDPCGCACCRLI